MYTRCGNSKLKAKRATKFLFSQLISHSVAKSHMYYIRNSPDFYKSCDKNQNLCMWNLNEVGPIIIFNRSHYATTKQRRLSESLELWMRTAIFKFYWSYFVLSSNSQLNRAKHWKWALKLNRNYLLSLSLASSLCLFRTISVSFPRFEAAVLELATGYTTSWYHDLFIICRQRLMD